MDRPLSRYGYTVCPTPGLARARLRIQGAQAHLAHQALDSLAIHRGPLGLDVFEQRWGSSYVRLRRVAQVQPRLIESRRQVVAAGREVDTPGFIFCPSHLDGKVTQKISLSDVDQLSS